MLRRYRALFRAPGSAAFCTAAFVARMPLGMYPLGIILIISARDGRYGFAGVLSAVYLFGSAAGSPVLSVLADRFGQRRVLLPSAIVHGGGVITFAAMLRTDAPDWLLVVPVAVFGLSYMSISSLVRARWVFLFADRPQMAMALSLESVLEEMIFIVGPLIATVLATNVQPVLVVYLSVALACVGSLRLASLRGTEPPPHPRDGSKHVSALRTRGLVALLPATVCMGAVYASAEISIIAFCGQQGHRGLSGVVLAAAAAGSGVAGLAYGAVDWRGDALQRFRVQSLIFAVLPFALFAATNVPVLAVAGFVLGTAVAPTEIALFALIQQIVSARTLTEGMTWAISGLKVGLGIGAILVGSIADDHGARAAFLVVVAASLSTAVIALTLANRSFVHIRPIDAELGYRPAPSPEVEASGSRMRSEG
jgi:MFS family permease